MKGSNKLELAKGHHTLTYAAMKPVLLSLGGNPEKVVQGHGRLTLRLYAATVLEMDPSDAKDTYSVQVESWPVDRFESQDDRDIPPPPEPSNYLKKLRMQVRRSMGVTREAFDDGPSIYQASVQDRELFEEQEALLDQERQDQDDEDDQDQADQDQDQETETETEKGK